jgi:hypothetical protein
MSTNTVKVYTIGEALRDSGYDESLSHTQLAYVEQIDKAYKRMIERGNGFDGSDDAFELLMQNNCSKGAILDNVGLFHKNLGYMLVDAGKMQLPKDSDDSDCLNLLLLVIFAMIYNAEVDEDADDADADASSGDADDDE